LELPSGDNLARLFDQCSQDLEWLVLYFHPDTALPQFPRVQVNFKAPETNPMRLDSHFCSGVYHFRCTLQRADRWAKPADLESFLVLIAELFLHMERTCEAL
jgi:hypothetical protein